METIIIRKAQPIGDQEIPDVQIVIGGSPPDFDDLSEYENFYKQQAHELFRALRFLPGGIFDQLLALMMQERASLFRISLFEEE